MVKTKETLQRHRDLKAPHGFRDTEPIMSGSNINRVGTRVS